MDTSKITVGEFSDPIRLVANPRGEASPADIRNGLDPVEVDALALQLHSLSCVVLGAADTLASPEHRNVDRAKARFILLGLREAGWSLAKAAH